MKNKWKKIFGIDNIVGSLNLCKISQKKFFESKYFELNEWREERNLFGCMVIKPDDCSNGF